MRMIEFADCDHLPHYVEVVASLKKDHVLNARIKRLGDGDRRSALRLSTTQSSNPLLYDYT